LSVPHCRLRVHRVLYRIACNADKDSDQNRKFGDTNIKNAPLIVRIEREVDIVEEEK